MIHKRHFKIGIFLNFHTNSLSNLEEQLEIVGRLSGIECVELLIEEINLPLKNKQLLKNNLNQYDKLIHAPFIGPTFISPQIELQKAALQILDKTISLARELNAKIITTHAGIISKFYDDDYIKTQTNSRYLKLINSQNNLPLVTVENLPKKHGFIKNYPSLQEIKNNEMWHKCNLALDIGHAILDKIDYLDFIKKNISRIKNIHLHNVIDKDDHQSLAKTGKINLNKLIQTLHENNYQGFINLEIPDKEDLINSWHYFIKQIKEYERS